MYTLFCNSYGKGFIYAADAVHYVKCCEMWFSNVVTVDKK